MQARLADSLVGDSVRSGPKFWAGYWWKVTLYKKARNGGVWVYVSANMARSGQRPDSETPTILTYGVRVRHSHTTFLLPPAMAQRHAAAVITLPAVIALPAESF